MRSSGAKGLPFSMPMEASTPSVSGSSASFGSSCTTWLTSSKKVKSLAWMVLNALPETLMNFIGGGFFASANRYTFANFLVASTAGLVLPLTTKPRHMKALP